jgi:uncharacterized LabA/DUF88 family protein
MEKAVVMIDAGFLSKVSYKLGEGHYFKYDLLKFAKHLCGKKQLIFKHLFFYNAPPFQSQPPTKEEKKKKEEYDFFVQKLKKNIDEVTIREGRCQRLKIDGKYHYKQKGVDTLITMDLMDIPLRKDKTNTVILIASDSDFVPVINRLKSLAINIFLYTYFERNRKSQFSTSNKLLGAVTQYFKLTNQDFQTCKFNSIN